MQKTKGFTLIELLVVIAIIGILSGLIIVSMSGAQNAAKDARIKADMDQMRSVAEIFKLSNSSYILTADLTGATACPSSGTSFLYGTGGTDGAALCTDITNQYSTGVLTINISSSSSSPKYCVQKVLPGGSTWCIDSTGAVGSTSVTCDSVNFNCANP
ncbi:MAG: type II secretion system protein [Candidatus Pacebacteria bacterium]|nr:type II secretion system protein [Candidatus Paceibacterota bacterium]